MTQFCAQQSAFVAHMAPTPPHMATFWHVPFVHDAPAQQGVAASHALPTGVQLPPPQRPFVHCPLQH
jgi:hypothetical protein